MISVASWNGAVHTLMLKFSVTGISFVDTATGGKITFIEFLIYYIYRVSDLFQFGGPTACVHNKAARINLVKVRPDK